MWISIDSGGAVRWWQINRANFIKYSIVRQTLERIIRVIIIPKNEELPSISQPVLYNRKLRIAIKISKNRKYRVYLI